MSNTLLRRSATLLVAGALALSACGSSEGLSGELVKDGIGCQPTQIDLPTDALPTIEPVAEAPTEVAMEDLEKGTGCAIETASYASIEILGATADDGVAFIDTVESGRPLTVQLAANTLLPALQEQLAEMQVGGVRKVTLPAADAYGKDGNELPKIGPDEALVFEIQLVGVDDTALYCNEANVPIGLDTAKPAEILMPLEAPAKLKVTTLTEGTGAELTAKDYATVQYTGIACSTGAQFDSSYDRGTPISFAMAEATPTASVGTVIPGWTQGLVGAKIGSTVQLDIPSALAYGARGSSDGGIGPNEPLTFVITIVSATEETPVDPTIPSIPAEGDPSATTTTVAGDPASTTTVPAAAEGTDESTTTTAAP